jgi:hypothetical protein
VLVDRGANELGGMNGLDREERGVGCDRLGGGGKVETVGEYGGR